MSNSDQEIRATPPGSTASWRSTIRRPAWRGGFVTGTILSWIAAGITLAIAWNNDGAGFLVAYVAFPLAAISSIFVTAFMSCRSESSSHSFVGWFFRLILAIVVGVPGGIFLGLIATASFAILVMFLLGALGAVLGIFFGFAATAAVSASITERCMATKPQAQS